MSIADARSTTLVVQALSCAGTMTASAVNADVVVSRIVAVSSGAGGATSYNSAVVPGLTAGAVVMAQQESSGAVVVPVVADVYEPGGAGTGFVVRLTADAAMPANADFWVYIVRF